MLHLYFPMENFLVLEKYNNYAGELMWKMYVELRSENRITNNIANSKISLKSINLQTMDWDVCTVFVCWTSASLQNNFFFVDRTRISATVWINTNTTLTFAWLLCVLLNLYFTFLSIHSICTKNWKKNTNKSVDTYPTNVWLVDFKFLNAIVSFSKLLCILELWNTCSIKLQLLYVWFEIVCIITKSTFFFD